jgi:hypothetical protein
MHSHAGKLGLAEAAQLLRIPYQQAHRLLLLGKLRGEKRGGRWFVDSVDVQRLARAGARRRKLTRLTDGVRP